MRIILLVIGVVIILGILWDGLRRLRLKRQQLADAAENPPAAVKLSAPAPIIEKPKTLDLFSQDDLQPENMLPPAVDTNVPPAPFLVLLVLAEPGRSFSVASLFRILVKHDCRFGEQNLFHRYAKRFIKPGERKEIYFSIASASQPGSFNILDQARTVKGIVFFMRLNDNRATAFEMMLQAAQAIAADLEGQVYNDKRELLNPEILAEYRQKLAYASA